MSCTVVHILVDEDMKVTAIRTFGTRDLHFGGFLRSVNG